MRHTAQVTPKLLFMVGVVARRLRERKVEVTGQGALDLAVRFAASLDPEALAAVEALDRHRHEVTVDEAVAIDRKVSAAIVAALSEVPR